MTEKRIDKTMRFNSKIQSLEKVNPLFSRATIRAMYTGANRNGSYFSKDSVLKSIDSIYNIPLVGEYIESTDNFGDHGTSIEIKDDNIKFITSTKPYGVVPESAEIYWETITEKDGTENEYLIIDGVYLWSGRYEELHTMLEQPYGQSMEIEIVNGNFAIIDGIETFNVDEFIFSAFCILGIDKDGAGHVEPAFESASVTAYSLDKEDFKSQFNQMVAELKFSLEKGGNETMPAKDNKETQETAITSDYEKTEVTQDDSIDSTQDDETKLENTPEESESTVDNSGEVFEENSDSGDGTEGETTTEPEETPEEEVVEPEPEVEPEIEEEKPKEDEADLTVNTDDDDNTSAAPAQSKKKEDFEAKFNSLQENFDSLTSKHETLQSELTELQSYKRQREEDDIKVKFESKISKEEFEQVFTDMKDSTTEAIEKELFALIGQKNYSIQQTVKESTNKISIPMRDSDSESDNPYSALEIYINK